MKTIGLLCALLAGSLAARTQQPALPSAQLGVRAGLNVSHLVSPAVSGLYRQWATGPLLGVLVSLPLSPRLTLQPEVLYSQKGARGLPTLIHHQQQYLAGTTDDELRYLDVPLLLRYRLGPLLPEAGVQASWLLSATSIARADGTEYARYDSRYGYEGFDAGYVLGLGAEVARHVQVGVRYTRSLTNCRTLGADLRNQAFQAQATYLFRLDRHR